MTLPFAKLPLPMLEYMNVPKEATDIGEYIIQQTNKTRASIVVCFACCPAKYRRAVDLCTTPILLADIALQLGQRWDCQTDPQIRHYRSIRDPNLGRPQIPDAA